MSKQSIGALHASVTANATQFVNEFQRADNAQRRVTANIRASVSKTIAQVNREFTLPKLAKGFLGGLGIGSGMQVVGMGMDLFAEKWKESANEAKEFSEYADRIRDTMREIKESRFNSFFDGALAGAKPGLMEGNIAGLQRDLARAEADYAAAMRDMAISGKSYASGPVRDDTGNIVTDDPYGGRFKANMSAREIGDEAAVRIDRANAEIFKIQDKIKAAQNKLATATKDMSPVIDKALKEFFDPIFEAAEDRPKSIDAALKSFFEPYDDRTRSVREIMKEDPADSKTFRRWDRAAGSLNVDDMTRRGLGTGANYKDVMSQTNTILGQILQEVRDAKMRHITATFGN